MTNTADTKFWAVVPAAGVGSRMRADLPKQYLPLRDRTVIEHTLHRLSLISELSGIVVAVAENDPWWHKLHIDIAKPIIVAKGGAERCHTVQNALAALNGKAQDNDWVLVHDAARPCVQPGDLHTLIRTLSAHPTGGLLGVPVRDTMKRTDTDNQIQATVDRNHLWHALTPQMFRFGMLQQALQKALDDEVLVTDEASAMEYAGYQPIMVEGCGDNIKITRPEDLALAGFYIDHQTTQGLLGYRDGMDDGG
ncbi:MAG: 2-C-methyl-D-erythritol 4-phosphate cytidylyltransferase [Gammaproteobacteria bacterium]|nr:2-C-methyl-D-erythritol 4-phosphate cytidylyltransferase [Gammaproteobacteria bacterium]MDH5652843.1 2-C-methyl-D-erythritol 4-phosphate cytidylyltransferase [Gammaproteobacteria bacterium]